MAMRVEVVESVLKHNDEFAAMNRRTLREAGVASLDLIGGPGSGKTTLLEQTLTHLRDEFRIGVLAGDMTTTRDADRLAAHCEHVVQINVGKACHLDANQVREGLARLDLHKLDLLIIENVGNLICPVGFDLGQDAKVGMFSVTEGDDKPAKHPYIILEADLLLLNKIDLTQHVRFDVSRFRADLAGIRSDIPLLEISAIHGFGLEGWCEWIRRVVAGRLPLVGVRK